MARWILPVLGLIVLAGGACLAGAGDAADQPAVQKDNPRSQIAHRKFMRRKLAASSRILEGLTTEDFEMLGQGADRLSEMSEAAEWRVSTDPLYRQYSGEFRRAVNRLQKSSREKSLDGSSLAWVEVQMSCIACHRWVRAELVSQ